MRTRRYTMCSLRHEGGSRGGGGAPRGTGASSDAGGGPLGGAGGGAPRAPQVEFRFDSAAFRDLFGRSLRVEGDVYMTEPAHPGSDSSNDTKVTDVADALSAMHRGHLREYQRLMADARPGVDSPIFVNLNQTPGFFGFGSSSCGNRSVPCLQPL